MFLHWKVRPLSASGFLKESDLCKHPAQQGGRLSFTPHVSVTRRIEGRPRRQVIHRFGVSVRPCCIVDRQAPQARLMFWERIMASFSRAPPAVVLARDLLVAQIGRKVPPPTPTEEELWEVYRVHATAPGRTDPYEQELELWLGARRLLERYLRERYPEETYSEWVDRRILSSHRTIRFGEPPLSKSPACFDLLGLRWPCSEVDVRKAWRRQAAVCHPDRGGTSEQFIRVKQAYEEALQYLARPPVTNPSEQAVPDWEPDDEDLQF